MRVGNVTQRHSAIVLCLDASLDEAAEPRARDPLEGESNLLLHIDDFVQLASFCGRAAVDRL